MSATPESIHTSSTKAIEISVRVWGSLRAKHLGWRGALELKTLMWWSYGNFLELHNVIQVQVLENSPKYQQFVNSHNE